MGWMNLATASTFALQFVMTAVLARLLSPSAFGLVAFATVLLRFVSYFATAGIAQASIQKAVFPVRTFGPPSP